MPQDNTFSELGFNKPPYWDSRYFNGIDRLSKPNFGVKIEKDIYVQMRDGVRLCVDIFRPDAEGKFPALLAASGYSKEIQSLEIPPQPTESFIFDHTIEAGDINFFVKRGYTYVVADVRGTGKSEGEWYGPYNKQEQADYYDLIEWIADQPWCSGNVGMAGISWFGIVQLLAAAQQPPHLKAIFPFEAIVDLYRWTYQGGILALHYWDLEGIMAVNNPKLDSERLYGKEKVEELSKQRLERDPDIRQDPYFVRMLSSYGTTHTAFKDMLLHPINGPFWWERSAQTKFDKIKVPLYHVAPWGGYVMASSVFETFTEPSLKITKKAGILFRHPLSAGHEGSELMLPLRIFSPEILRWYDHWLKGIDTGMMNEPPIKIFVMGANRYRYENEWPLARTEWFSFYLKRFGKLSVESEEDEDLPPDPMVHRPPTISNEIGVLRYISPPFKEPVEFTGPVALYLHASLDQDDANFIAKLYDVSPSGGRVFLERGLLKASFRELDKERSEPWLPCRTYTEQSSVSPGTVYEYAISMNNISNVFQANHQMLLEITTADPLPQVILHKMALHNHVIGQRLTYYKIFRDSTHQSRLLLPLIRSTPSELWLK